MYTEYNHVEYNFYVYIYLWYMVHYRLCFLIPTFGQSYDLVPWVSLVQVGRVTWCTWRREASKGRRIGEFERGGKIYTPSRGVFFEICWLDYRFISSFFFVGVVMYEWIFFITPPKNTVWLGFSRVFASAEGTHLLTSTEKVMGWQEEGDSDSDSLEPSPHDEHLWWQILDPHFHRGFGVKISGVLKRSKLRRWKTMFHFFFFGGGVMFKCLVIEGNIDNLRFFFGFKFSCIPHVTGIISYYYVYIIWGFTSLQPLKRWGSTPLSTHSF